MLKPKLVTNGLNINALSPQRPGTVLTAAPEGGSASGCPPAAVDLGRPPSAALVASLFLALWEAVTVQPRRREEGAAVRSPQRGIFTQIL